MAHLWLISHMIQKHSAGPQATHWDATKKITILNNVYVSPLFVLIIVPVHCLWPGMAVFLHMTDQLKSTHY